MVTKIELRVHAGAPSSRRDDDRYRNLAEAYLGRIGRRVVSLDADDTTVTEATEAETLRRGPSVANEVLHDPTIDASISILRHRNETTFVEDTQLAYNALESQLQTSSLTIPEVTPAKRRLPADLRDDSPWPEDLEGHSPAALRSSPPPHRVLDAPVPSPVQERVAKKPRLQQNGFKAPAFKPFRPPLKRTTPSPRSTPGPRAPFNAAARTPSDREASQSSYLKTPVLVTPEERRRVETVRPGKPSLDSQSAVDHPQKEDEGTSRMPPAKGKLPDYRERTPRQQLHLPYVPFQESSQVGLAFVGQPRHDATTPEPHHHQSESKATVVSGAETTSELPTSYSLSDLTSEGSRARLRNLQRSTSDPGPLAGGSHGSEGQRASLRSCSQPPQVERAVAGGPRVNEMLPLEDSVAAKITAKQVPVTEAVPAAATERPSTLEQAPKRTITDPSTLKPIQPVPSHPAAPNSSRPAASAATSQAPPVAVSFDDLPSEIRPPEPAVSTDNFTTHITDSLRWLAESELADHYNPVSVSRDIRPLERGYWLIQTSAWSEKLQLDFWQFLVKMVGSGRAGWATWCHRESEDKSLGTVQVFCWGEVVKHIYLLLYVASQSKVRKIGMQWIDAGGEIVVQMRRPP